MRAELLGTNDHFLVDPALLTRELPEILSRLKKTNALPKLRNTRQFNRDHLCHGWLVAKIRLNNYLRYSPRATREEIDDARFVFEVHDLLQDALLLGDYRVFERRLKLSQARRMIGERDFNAGKLPRAAAPARQSGAW